MHFCCVRFSFFCTKPREWLGEYLQNDLFCVELNVKPQLSQSIWPTRGHSPNGISMGSAIFAHLMAECCRTSLGMSFPIKIALRKGDLDPHLIHASLGPPESKTQTASRSVQPFLHSSCQSVIRHVGACPAPSKLPLPMG